MYTGVSREESGVLGAPPEMGLPPILPAIELWGTEWLHPLPDGEAPQLLPLLQDRLSRNPTSEACKDFAVMLHPGLGFRRPWAQGAPGIPVQVCSHHDRPRM